MCIRPIRLPGVTGSESALVPCGKCPECLAHKANEMTVRAVREAEYFKDFFFTTMTYDNEHIPMQVCECHLTDYFEQVVDERYVVDDTALREEFFDNADYTIVYNKKGYPCKRYDPYVYDRTNVYDDENVIETFKIAYYTVDNEDFKKYLKSARMKYLRTFGKSLPKFKYCAVPEYGTASYRPHYHVLWFGLNQEQINFMMTCWKYGEIADVQRVKYTVEDMAKVAHYVAQYGYKGKYDTKHIEDGYCKKPRRCISIDFGIGDAEDLARRESWWKCEDLFGPIVDVNDLMRFDTSERKDLAEAMLKRRYYDMCGFKYPIPQYFAKKMFYVPRRDVDLKKITTNNLLTYEEKKQAERDLDRPRVRKVRQSDGTYMYKIIKPSPNSKVASELQKLVTTALFKQLDRDLAKSMEYSTAQQIQSWLEVTPSNIDALTDVFANAQLAQEKTTEHNFINKLADSIF